MLLRVHATQHAPAVRGTAVESVPSRLARFFAKHFTFAHAPCRNVHTDRLQLSDLSLSHATRTSLAAAKLPPPTHSLFNASGEVRARPRREGSSRGVGANEAHPSISVLTLVLSPGPPCSPCHSCLSHWSSTRAFLAASQLCSRRGAAASCSRTAAPTRCPLGRATPAGAAPPVVLAVGCAHLQPWAARQPCHLLCGTAGLCHALIRASFAAQHNAAFTLLLPAPLHLQHAGRAVSGRGAPHAPPGGRCTRCESRRGAEQGQPAAAGRPCAVSAHSLTTWRDSPHLHHRQLASLLTAPAIISPPLACSVWRRFLLGAGPRPRRQRGAVGARAHRCHAG